MKKLTVLFSLVVFAGHSQFTYTYTGKPRFQILATQNNGTLGVIQLELFPKIAPLHVRNFDSLVSKQFYDTTAFHRVVPGFVIQGGDPNSRKGPVNTWGQGHPSQPRVQAEFSVARHERGILSAARLANDTNSATSQFFIVVASSTFLDKQYSVYGRVTSGMSVVDTIVSTPTVAGTQRPVDKIEMFVTYIGSNDSIPLPPTLLAPRNDSVNKTMVNVLLKWGKVSDAVFYHLEVADDSLFTNVFRSFYVTSLQQAVNPLVAGQTYYWRVKANNGGHITSSPVWRFHTRDLPNDETGIDKLNAEATIVFPSPASSIVQFRSQPGDRIEVFDCVGRTVEVVRSEATTTSLDISKWSRGVYFYRVTGDTRITGGRLIVQ